MISVGIDIGSYSVKVAEAEAVGKDYRIRSFEEYPLSQDPTKDLEIQVLDVLRLLRTRYKDSGAHINFAIRQSGVAFRRLRFPFKERHKIVKSLPFELEDDTPFDIAESVFDARVTRYMGGQADVLACACPRERVENCLQLAKDGGFDPEIISVDSLALANLFEDWREAPMDVDAPKDAEDDEAPEPAPESFSAQLILELGHSESRLVVIKDGAVLEAHGIDWGGRDVAEAICEKYKMHFVEALKELTKKSFVLLQTEGATGDQIIFSDVIKGSVEKLSQRLLLLVIDLKAKYHLKFENIFLMGGTSQIKNLGPFLTQQLEIPVNRVKSVSRHPELNFTDNSRGELTCATAIGLAIEGLRRPKNPPLNLLRGALAKQGQHFKEFWDKWNHAISVGLAIFVVLVAHSVTRDYLAEEMATKGNDALMAQAKTFGIKTNRIRINSYLKDRKKQIKAQDILQSLQNINSALDIVKGVSQKISKTDKLDVRKFSVRNNKVRLEGFTERKKAISNIKLSLKKLAIDGQVKPSKPKIPIAPGKFGFGYEFSVERKGVRQ